MLAFLCAGNFILYQTYIHSVKRLYLRLLKLWHSVINNTQLPQTYSETFDYIKGNVALITKCHNSHYYVMFIMECHNSHCCVMLMMECHNSHCCVMFVMKCHNSLCSVVLIMECHNSHYHVMFIMECHNSHKHSQSF